VSDTWQGPGWWLASDGKWYSPDQLPGPVPQPPNYSPSGAPGPIDIPGGPVVLPSGIGNWGPTTADYSHGAPPFDPTGALPPSAPPYGAIPPSPAGSYGYHYGYPPGYPYSPYGYQAIPTTNGWAVASFVCSFFFWLVGAGSVLAIIFGFMARRQVGESNGAQKGKDLALAGIILGFIGVLFWALAIALGLIAAHHCNQTGGCTFNTSVGSRP
jgi:Domain of unknown function (DUF4190)